MSAVAGPNSTVGFIRLLVRELTASSSEGQLATSYIDQTLNNIYLNDFPYAIKLDQMRDVYTFFTQPYVDQYPLDVNYNQGVRGPFYVDGIQGNYSKDREDFFRMWPKFPTLFNQFGSNSLQGGISFATQANPCQITSTNHGLTTGNTIYIYGVVGMTQLNGNSYTITVVDASNFTLDAIDSTGYTAYVSGGTWNLTPVTFNFTVPGPILAGEVLVGGTDILGNPMTFCDNSYGVIQKLVSNARTSVPAQNTNPAIPGMYNVNLGSPGLNNPTDVGSVNYVTGQISFSNPLPLATGTTLTVWVAQYQTGRPYSLLFWNNTFTIRPVPKLIHRITVETYLTPVQFMLATDSPILNQWAFYLGYLTAAEILRRRQDWAGLQNILEGVKRQEQLVLERQGTEEINQRNRTLFSSTSPNQNANLNGWLGGYY